MTLLLVAVSGTVGKQVIKTSGSVNTYQAKLKGVLLTPSAATASIKIRDGNASGEVVLWARVTSAGATTLSIADINHKFTKGMHVKVLGAAAEAYLVLE